MEKQEANPQPVRRAEKRKGLNEFSPEEIERMRNAKIKAQARLKLRQKAMKIYSKYDFWGFLEIPQDKFDKLEKACGKNRFYKFGGLDDTVEDLDNDSYFGNAEIEKAERENVLNESEENVAPLVTERKRKPTPKSQAISLEDLFEDDEASMVEELSLMENSSVAEEASTEMEPAAAEEPLAVEESPEEEESLIVEEPPAEEEEHSTLEEPPVSSPNTAEKIGSSPKTPSPISKAPIAYSSPEPIPKTPIAFSSPKTPIKRSRLAPISKTPIAWLSAAPEEQLGIIDRRAKHTEKDLVIMPDMVRKYLDFLSKFLIIFKRNFYYNSSF